MKHLSLLLAFTALAACGDKDDADTGTDTDSDITDTDTTDTDTTDTTDTVTDPTADLAAALVGDWSSAACEDIGGGNYLLRDFTFPATGWELVGHLYSDASCTAENFSFAVTGPLEILGPSATVDGAYEADFGTTTKTLTPANQGIADYLNGQPAGSCGTATWEVGVAQSIADTGCAAFGLDNVADCPEEHDLVHLDGDTLLLGDRSASLCESRPTALSAYPLVRQ